MKALSILLLVMLTGCATIVNGPRQSISVSSDPSRAEVLVNGNPRGMTPVSLKLGRRGSQVISIRAEGYRTHEVVMTRDASGLGWVMTLLGNWWNGVLPGFVVDLATGSIYELSPEQVHANLRQQGAAAERGVVYIMATLEADPEWQEVARMERE